jgi:hypothetical protein
MFFLGFPRLKATTLDCFPNSKRKEIMVWKKGSVCFYKVLIITIKYKNNLFLFSYKQNIQSWCYLNQLTWLIEKQAGQRVSHSEMWQLTKPQRFHIPKWNRQEKKLKPMHGHNDKFTTKIYRWPVHRWKSLQCAVSMGVVCSYIVI